METGFYFISAGTANPGIKGLHKMTWQERIQKSILVQGLSARAKRVPSRTDYINALIDQGDIQSEEELGSKPDLAVGVHHHWIRQGQIGCVFAQALVTQADAYGLGAITFADGNDMDVPAVASAVTTAIESIAEAAVSENTSVLFPNLTDFSILSTLIVELGKISEWSLWRQELFVDPESPDSFILVGLDYLLDGQTPSAVLALGPFDILPMTRRGPITSLELRLKTEHAEPPKRPLRHLGANLVSHLARIPFGPGRNQAQESDPTWQTTRQLKLAVLEGYDDPRAKADVTLAVPVQTWVDVIRSSA